MILAIVDDLMFTSKIKATAVPKVTPPKMPKKLNINPTCKNTVRVRRNDKPSAINMPMSCRFWLMSKTITVTIEKLVIKTAKLKNKVMAKLSIFRAKNKEVSRSIHVWLG